MNKASSIETSAVPDDPTRLIEAWFAEHRDDGDFVLAARAAPYSVIGPKDNGGRVIYATKSEIVSTALEACEASEEFCLIGRYGLPSAADAIWIRELVGSRAILFLGDMDPPDLMIFAWLRASLHPARISHLGVNEVFLRALELSLPNSSYIPCTQSEQKSLALLKVVFPDFAATVGTKCAQTLEQGRKIELEAVVSAKESIAAILLPTLTMGT